MKTELTKKIENVLYQSYVVRGNFVAFEILLKYNPAEICDCIVITRQADVLCFEIKISKSDFHSKAKLSFMGNKNYFAMTRELYGQVKNEIPQGIGVMVLDGYGLKCMRTCKYKEISMHEKQDIIFKTVFGSYNQTTHSIVYRASITFESPFKQIGDFTIRQMQNKCEDALLHNTCHKCSIQEWCERKKEKSMLFNLADIPLNKVEKLPLGEIKDETEE